MVTPFSSLPDSSRIWIFPADRKLSPEESRELLATLDSYLANWEAHGAPVGGARELRYDQFVIIAADPEVTAPSGCSIDDMTRAIKAASAKFHVDFFSPMKVFYKSGNDVRVVSRSEFRTLANEGSINEETTVFDNAITSLADLRAGKWELPASESWHRSFLLSVTV